MRHTLGSWAAIVVGALSSGSAASVQSPSSSAFVLLAGNGDTVAVERFERTGERLRATLLFRAAGGRFDFEAGLARDQSVTWFRNEFRQASADSAARPVQSARITFSGDSAIVLIEPGGISQRLGTRQGAIPLLNPSFALVEQVVRRALALGGDTAVPVFLVQGGMTVSFGVRRHSGDSVLVDAAGTLLRLATLSDGTILGGMVPSQGLRIVRSGSLPEGALRPERPDYSAPAGAPYSAEEVVLVARDGSRLIGTLTIPRGVGRPVPALITISGSGLQDRDSAIPSLPGYRPFRQIADTLGRAGIAVLRWDDRGFGGSENRAAAITTELLAADVSAALDFLSKRPEIDSTRLALLGHSEGALVASLVAQHDRRVRALVLMASPGSPGRVVIEGQNRFLLAAAESLTAAQRDSLLALSMRTVDSAAARQPWLQFFLNYDPLPAARSLRIPVLVLHGSTDRQVPPEEGEKLTTAMRKAGNSDVTLVIFPGRNHLFLEDPSGDWRYYSSLPSRTVASEVLGQLTQWLVSRLR